MTGTVAASFAAAGFALIHLHGGRLTLLSPMPRGGWLSFAGGALLHAVLPLAAL